MAFSPIFAGHHRPIPVNIGYFTKRPDGCSVGAVRLFRRTINSPSPSPPYRRHSWQRPCGRLYESSIARPSRPTPPGSSSGTRLVGRSSRGSISLSETLPALSAKSIGAPQKVSIILFRRLPEARLGDFTGVLRRAGRGSIAIRAPGWLRTEDGPDLVNSHGLAHMRGGTIGRGAPSQHG
jgi:hypothetical protein